MNTLEGHIILNRSSNYVIKLFIIITLFIISSLIFILNIKFTKYFKTNGIVVQKNSDYYISLYIIPKNLDIIKQNNKLIINENYYNYSIKKISNDYILDDKLNKYIVIDIVTNLPIKEKINNNVLNIKIKESNKKIFYYIKEYIKDGIKND